MTTLSRRTRARGRRSPHVLVVSRWQLALCRLRPARMASVLRLCVALAAPLPRRAHPAPRLRAALRQPRYSRGLHLALALRLAVPLMRGPRRHCPRPRRPGFSRNELDKFLEANAHADRTLCLVVITAVGFLFRVQDELLPVQMDGLRSPQRHSRIFISDTHVSVALAHTKNDFREIVSSARAFARIIASAPRAPSPRRSKQRSPSPTRTSSKTHSPLSFDRVRVVCARLVAAHTRISLSAIS